jgi:hypothetical protein
MSLKRSRTEDVEINVIAQVKQTNPWGCQRKDDSKPADHRCGHEVVSGGHAFISAQLPFAHSHATSIVAAAEAEKRFCRGFEESAEADKEHERILRPLAAALCAANPSGVMAATCPSDKTVPAVKTFSTATFNFEGDDVALSAWRANMLHHVRTKWAFSPTSVPSCTHPEGHAHSDLDLFLHWMLSLRKGTLHYCKSCTSELHVRARIVTHEPRALSAADTAALFH